MAVWSPAGESGEMGEKSPATTTTTAVSPTASAASTAAESAAAMPPVTGAGKQAGLAHWMSVMAEHMNSAESNVQSYAASWPNGLEVHTILKFKF